MFLFLPLDKQVSYNVWNELVHKIEQHILTSLPIIQSNFLYL
jgi:hypothetical protein